MWALRLDIAAQVAEMVILIAGNLRLDFAIITCDYNREIHLTMKAPLAIIMTRLPFNSRYIAIALLLLISVTYSFSVITTSLMGDTHFQTKDSIMDLLAKDYPKNLQKVPAQQREEAIRSYILDCCSSEQHAINLLEDNGFEIIRTTDAAKVAELNAHFKNSKKHWADKHPEYIVEDYTGFVLAKKSAMVWYNLLHLPAEYEIHLFIINDHVSWVTARINRTMP